jgi:hypothetical protein
VARAAPSSARRDVEQQLALDRIHGGAQGALLARMAAVLGAQKALAHREEGAPYALRQSLVDLAAIAELLADDLPAPPVWRSGARSVTVAGRP